MTVLVTGSNGFLGAALVERLLAHGEGSVRCMVRAGSDRSRLEAVAERQPSAAMVVQTGSLASPEDAAEAIADATVVYHLAAALRGSPADMFLNTVVTSKNLLEAVVRCAEPPKVVLVSSFGVYGVAELRRGQVVDEQTRLEPHPERRDLYSHAKLRQEQLFWDYRDQHPYPLVVLRPGVIYGPGGTALSNRIGLGLPGIYLELGGRNPLPLSYVDSCAEALVVAGRCEEAVGEIYNVHDEPLPSCHEYFVAYQKHVRPVRSLRLPYPLLLAGSALVERYHHWSKGQLPAILTPYKVAASWKGNRFDNRKLKALGWQQLVSTEEGMRQTFDHLRAKQEAAS